MLIENNITFDEFKTKPRFEDNIKTSKMVNFLIRKGIVKNEKQGNSVLLIIALLFLLASAFIFAKYVFGVDIGGTEKTFTPEEIQEQKDRFRQMNSQNVNNTETNQ